MYNNSVPAHNAQFNPHCIPHFAHSQIQTSKPVSLDSLTIEDLYGFPAVKNLVDHYQALCRTHVMMEAEQRMLKEELAELASRRALMDNINRMYTSGGDFVPEDWPETSGEPSVSPDDSISQAGSPAAPTPVVDVVVLQPASQPQPLTQCDRPQRYPISVLWHFKDCQEEIGASTTRSKSRPNMERCIRFPDGRFIGKYEWRGITNSTKRAIQEILRPLGPANEPLRTRTYYKTSHPEAWRRAIASLEAQQPLTALCALHWKAEHVLGQVLVSQRALEVRSARSHELCTPMPMTPEGGASSGVY